MLRSADVLQPTAATTTVTRRDGGLRVQDGPFAETKEALAGVFVLEVPDLDAAIGWAEKCPGARGACSRCARSRPPSSTASGRADGGGRGRGQAGPAPLSRGRRPGAADVAARDSYGRLLALLAASTSDLAAAEDALADAFERALRTWPAQGVPASPDAWLLTVARNRLRDHWKSAEAQRTVPLDGRAGLAASRLDDLDIDAIPDRRLELMLVCAHPAIERAAHTPLMLNTVLGFTAEQVGRAFSMPTATMATRLVRAKKRIKAAGIPFRVPDRATSRRGWPRSSRRSTAPTSSTGRRPGRRPVRCPRRRCSWPRCSPRWLPADPEAHGLAALVELSAARAPARLDAGGRFVPLADQDPARWDRG